MFKYCIKRVGLFVFCLFVFFVGRSFLRADGNDFSSSGSGTSSDPYIVSTVAQFKNLAGLDDSYNDKYFKLANNIDLGGYTFSGIRNVCYFDGDGHIIKNFKINNITSLSTRGVAGLFVPENCQLNISNVGIENAIIDITLNSSYENGVQVGILASWVNSANNCFVRNSTLKVNGNASTPVIIGMILGIVSGGGTTQNCYVCNCSLDLSNFNNNGRGVDFGHFLGQANIKSTVKNCYAKAENNYAAKVSTNEFCVSNNSTLTNCHYNEENMTGPNAVTSMNLGNAFRATESYPVLKLFDTKINSMSFSDDEVSHEFAGAVATKPLKIKLNLSDTLNQQSQGDKIVLYVDDNATPIAQTTTGNELSIPVGALNNLSVGDHELQAKVVDFNNGELFTLVQKLSLKVNEPPIPEIKSIVVEPASYSKSKANSLEKIKVTLAGENFSSGYKVTLVFTSKEDRSQTTNIDCGNFSGVSPSVEIKNITGDNLNTIKSLPIGKYLIEVVITK